jgi:hypothetical protein
VRYQDLIQSVEAPYAFATGLENGTVLKGRDHYPDLEIVSSSEVPVKDIRWQLLRVKAEHPNQDGSEQYLVGRLIAILENDEEVEVGERTCVLADIVDTQIDITTCASCGRKNMDASVAKIHEGQAYCPVCYVED